MKEIIIKLLQKCGLGSLKGDIVPVSGGFLHKMYRVQTTTGDFAIKCLNPEIMKRPDVMENYSRAEKLERILEDNGVPIVPALSFDTDDSDKDICNTKMVKIYDRDEVYYFYVFRWQKGSITDWNDITEEQCRRAGEILGRIHAIDSRNTGKQEPEISRIDFRNYLDIAENYKKNVYGLLAPNIDLLEYAQEKLNAARKALPLFTAIIDDDMDPKNVMWEDDKAYVIDLECLDYGNPVASCLNLALQWSGTVNERYNESDLSAFFEGYLKEYDNGFREYAGLFGIAYTWVEWLEYNIRRALGMEGQSEEEISIGEKEVRNTIGRIRYLYSLESDICGALNKITEPRRTVTGN